MKSFVVGLFVLVSLGSTAADLPQGSYSGEGVWWGEKGGTGNYSLSMVVGSDSITWNVAYAGNGDAGEKSYTLTVESRGNGFFDVLDEDGRVSGYLFCNERLIQLVYDSRGVEVSESMVLNGSTMIKSGSKSVGGYSIVWHETLVAD